ncbi:MAG: hypothetical protein HZB12_00770 [Candidatus Yonathbacteria bacterium]|nr:hypothetical protein [Candidatus Yonathbacteria bacterium]
MPTRRIPVLLVVLLVAIAVVNWLAESYYWYWRMRWFDMPMHFAGGVWLAGVAMWWRYYHHEKLPVSFLQILTTCLVAALGVGLLWEVFEAELSFVTAGHINAVPDTLKDLLFDTIGGIVVAGFVWFRDKLK